MRLLFKYFVYFSTLNFLLVSGVFAKNDKSDLLLINKKIKEKKYATELIERQTKQINKDIKNTQNRMVVIARDIKKYERQLSLYDKQLSSLFFKEKNLNTKIEQNNGKLVEIIALFENIAKVPKGYLFFAKSKTSEFFNTSVLLKALIEILNSSKEEFTNDLNDLIKLKNDILTAKQSIKSINNRVRNEKNKIAKLIETKKQKQKQLNKKQAETKREINRLVAESKTIEEFLRKAEQLRKNREKKFVPRNNIGTKSLPVIGEVTTYFGENRTTGVKSKGIYLKSIKGLQVIAPSDSDVVFAGSFYGYKNLLILHSRDNYYIIMGGMDSVVVDEGQSLLAGEPVGETGSTDFYIEVRDGAVPVNPFVYFKL